MKDVLERYAAKTRTSLSMVAVIVMILAGLSACAQDNTTTTPTFSNQTPITIGTSLSSTLDFAQDGQSMEQGYRLWAQTINNNGGLLGRPVQLVILHDNSDPAQVAKNYNTLIYKDHVNLVIGPFSTLLTKAADPVVSKAGYALIEGAGGGNSVFTNGWKNIFDVSLPVANNLTTFAYYILSLPASQRPKTVAYATSDDPFTQPQLVVAKQLLESAGVTTVFNNTGDGPCYNQPYCQPYQEEQSDYIKKDIPPVAEQIVKSHAQVVILGTLLPDLQAYITIFKKDHYNPEALIATAGPDLGQDFIKAVGGVKYTEGVFVPNGWYPEANNFQNAQMVQDYLAQYGGTADQINADVAEAYSVGQVLEQVVTMTKSLDNAKIISALHSGVAFNSVQGTVQFDPQGRNTSALSYLFQWQSGTLISVYPSSAAAENPEFPKLNAF
jgi:branched-chain amino acid transport system substrate-binding protein